MADRAIAIMQDPDLARRLSEAAVAKARSLDHRMVLRDWQHVLEAVTALKPDRTNVRGARLRSLLYPPGWKLLRGRDPASHSTGAAAGTVPVTGAATEPVTGAAAVPAGEKLVRFAGLLSVKGGSERTSIGEAAITLTAISDDVESVVELPVKSRHADAKKLGRYIFWVTAEVDAADIVDRLETPGGRAQLRLRFTWRNSSWQTIVKPYLICTGPLENVSRERDGALLLTR
jgi:hypothetical protein